MNKHKNVDIQKDCGYINVFRRSFQKKLAALMLALIGLFNLTSCYEIPPYTAMYDSPKFAVAQSPTPVLSTFDFRHVFGGADGRTLLIDSSWDQINEVEFIALPGTVFNIHETIKAAGTTMYSVTTPDYPYPTQKGYYIDSRFVTLVSEKPADRVPVLPSKQKIIAQLRSLEGGDYVWGGNMPGGVPQLLTFYPPTGELDPAAKKKWELKGAGDCSGILYWATDGYTPRNTSALLTFGEPVHIAGLSVHEIAAKLQPLDLIVWKGHTIIVIDNGQTIESRYDYDPTQEGAQQTGVHIRTIEEVLEQTISALGRMPVDTFDPDGDPQKQFMIRRPSYILN